MAEHVTRIDHLPEGEQRSLVLAGLKVLFNNTNLSPQIIWLAKCVAYAAVKREAQSDQAKWGAVVDGLHAHSLAYGNDRLVRDIVWDLIGEGVLRPGAPEKADDQGWPFLHLTKRGKEILEGESTTPYDPDGYLRHLQEVAPSIDPVILTYVEESLRTYRMGCRLSSAVTLGCASEKAFLLLVDAFARTLQGDAKKKFEENTKGRPIARVYREFKLRFESHLKPSLPDHLKVHSDVMLDGVFTLIRTMRNDAGHPTGEAIPDRVLYAAINMFIMYVENIYALMGWMATNSAGSP